MGTISDKLVYLDGTREQIKENLNKFGSNITENDTFRSYSNVLNDIYDKLLKVSGNGSNFSLENAQNGKLDSFGMDGNTEQTTYSGKNLLAYTSYGEEKQGVTTTYDSEDGALILNGTANNTFSNLTKESSIDIATGTYTFSIKEAKNYNIRLAITCTDNTTINATINKGSTSTTVNINKDTLNQRIFIYENNTLSGTTFTNEKIYAQLESGSTATSFEPYVGGTPSPNPDYPQDVKVVENEQVVNVTGKNILNITDAYSNSTGLEKSYVNGVASLTWNAGFAFYMEQNESHNLPLKMFDSSKTYTISFKHKGNSLYLRFDETANNILATETDSDYTDYSYTFTGLSQLVIKFVRKENSGTAYLKDFQIEINNQATTYEPYQSKDYEIDLGDIELCKIEDYKDVIFKNNQLSEYYDSTLDEDSWYIKKEIGKVVLDGNITGSIRSDIQNQNTVCFRTDADVTNILTGSAPISDHFTTLNNTSDVEHIRYIGITEYRFQIFLSKTKATTSSEVISWLNTHNTTVYYVLATPTYETITDETLISQLESIETFTGLNNFSVSNDNNVLPTLYVSRLKELGKLE